MGKVYLSQCYNELVKLLVNELSSANSACLQKRWILVPNNSLKQWLSIQIALHSEKKNLIGCKICSPEEALISKESALPTSLEMLCLIYNELGNGNDRELIHFLDAGASRKRELSEQLALLFFEYGKYMNSFFEKGRDGWQASLFEKLFQKSSFSLPFQFLPHSCPIKSDPVHCFGFDFLPEIFWKSLARIPSLNVYQFSPCVHFWEDLCTNWERRNLSSFWKKRGASTEARKQLETYLSEGPPLLANWGKLGRETLKILDPFSFEIEEAYTPLQEKDFLLNTLQKEILFFETRTSSLPIDDSIQIFLTGSSRMNEVEVLREEILRLSAAHHIPFSEMAVLTPDIQLYVPLIEFLFSDPAAFIPYRIFDIDIGLQSSFYQGLCRLAELIKNEWGCEDLIELIETPSVYRRWGWEREKIDQFSDWLRQIFQSCDWKAGFKQLVHFLITLFDEPIQRSIPFSDSDLMEEILFFLQSLEADLAPLRTKACRLRVWAESWENLAEKYLTYDSADESDQAAWKEFQKTMKSLRDADFRLGDASYPFDLIEPFLHSSCTGSIHGNHLHAVRIESIKPGSILPARALFFLGMDEEAFPRKKIHSSLDLLKKEPIYVPEKPDIDRYLFLQSLFAARNFLRISYGHLSPDEGKVVNPSLLIQELLNALGPEISSSLSRVVIKKTAEIEMPFHFSIRCPEKPVFQQERTIALADLASFARHPWKHYLKKREGIYLEDRSERSFGMQRASLLRSSIEWPLEKIFASQSDLLPGIFKDALRLDTEKRVVEWKRRLKEWGQHCFSLFFLESAQERREITNNRIEFPPLELKLEDGSLVRLIGDVNFAMEQGVLHLADDHLSPLLKNWPEILAGSVALNSSQIYFLKSGKVKTIADPVKSLKAFVSYYLRCSTELSPLIPDWADSLLRKGIDFFETKTLYDDHVVEWLLPRLEMPSTEQLFQEWDWLKKTFEDLIALYPTRKSKKL